MLDFLNSMGVIFTVGDNHFQHKLIQILNKVTSVTLLEREREKKTSVSAGDRRELSACRTYMSWSWHKIPCGTSTN
jgi:hypothetical protein